MDFKEDPALITRMLASLEDQLRGDAIPKHLPHVTELIYCLTRSWYNRFQPVHISQREVTIFLLGSLLEVILLQKQKYHVGGIVDGISFESDFIAAYDDIPGELKTTRMSASRDPSMPTDKGGLPQTWIKQILSYMRCLDVREMSLVVFFLLGDYKPPFPSLKAWRVVADIEEIVRNWIWLEDRRDTYLLAVERAIPPTPFEHNEEWECENCPYLFYCKAHRLEQGLPLPEYIKAA